MEAEIIRESKRIKLGHLIAEVKYKETLQNSIIRFTMTYLKYLNTEKPDYWLKKEMSKKYAELTELDTEQVVDIFLFAHRNVYDVPEKLQESYTIIYNDYWICQLIETAIDQPYLAGYRHTSTYIDRHTLFRFLEYGTIFSGSDDLDLLKEKIKELTEELKS